MTAVLIGCASITPLPTYPAISLSALRYCCLPRLSQQNHLVAASNQGSGCVNLRATATAHVAADEVSIRCDTRALPSPAHPTLPLAIPQHKRTRPGPSPVPTSGLQRRHRRGPRSRRPRNPRRGRETKTQLRGDGQTRGRNKHRDGHIRCAEIQRAA